MQVSKITVWRAGAIGRYLFMAKDGRLPLICVKSNQPAVQHLRRKLAWHNSMIYLLLLCNILIFAVVAIICQKKADIEIGLSEEWFAKRRRACWIGWSSVLLGIGSFAVFMGLAITDNGDVLPLLFGLTLFLSITVPLVGGIYGLLCARMVTAQKIDENYVYLRGCHPNFLARFPEWPGT